MASQAQQQPPSQKSWTKVEKAERVYGTSETQLRKEAKEPAKKKKTAAAGGGANPPKNPPKGPKGPGPKGPDKGDDSNKKKPHPNDKSMGGLTKSTKNTEKPANPFKRDNNTERKKQQPEPKDKQFKSDGYLVKKNSPQDNKPKKK
jgi:hypothetical protein